MRMNQDTLQLFFSISEITENIFFFFINTMTKFLN